MLGLIVLAVASLFSWFFLYSGDLPNIKALVLYAPKQVNRVSDPCLDSDIVAIPYDAIGHNFRSALKAAEGHPADAIMRGQISRMMFCKPSRLLNRHLDEARVAAQLKWRYSRDELLTIYANRASFGEDCYGIYAAAGHYFRKEPSIEHP